MLKVLRQYYPVRNIMFVVLENALIFFPLLAGLFLVVPKPDIAGNHFYLFKIFIVSVFCQICFYYADLYEMKKPLTVKAFLTSMLKALVMICVVMVMMSVFFPGLMINPEVLVIGFTLMVVIVGINRYCYSLVLRQGLFNQRIIMIGAGDLAQKIVDEIQRRDDCGYEISYILNHNRNEMSYDIKASFIHRGNYLGLCELAKDKGIKKIVVAIDEKRGNFPSEELLKCRIAGVEILEGNSFYEMLSGKLVVDQLYPSWLIFSDGFRKSTANRIIKRAFDVLLSLVLLIVSLPVMMVAAVLIKIDSKGPVFYSQERVGRNHKAYRIYKFRSMVDNAEGKCGPQFTCENDHRITAIGHYLRKLRVDELPQLWNVVKGDMSFVGPRPERSFFVSQFEKEIPYYRERFSVKPGITGWAQISYQYCANAEETLEKLNFDLFYIKNMSILMDLMIVMRTVKIVLFGTGAR